MNSDDVRPSLKVRFGDPQTLEVLRVVSGELGTSMNTLAEGLIARGLLSLREGLALELEQTLAKLRTYTAPSIEEQAARFARAEVEFEDPMRSTHRFAPMADPYGVGAAFAHPVER